MKAKIKREQINVIFVGFHIIAYKRRVDVAARMFAEELFH